MKIQQATSGNDTLLERLATGNTVAGNTVMLSKKSLDCVEFSGMPGCKKDLIS